MKEVGRTTAVDSICCYCIYIQMTAHNLVKSLHLCSCSGWNVDACIVDSHYSQTYYLYKANQVAVEMYMGICSIYAHHDCQATLQSISFSSIAGGMVCQIS